ncbi:uncharacterized protein LOC129222663 [Uloborus diversus]|uniref:uncharacterized protein LOC129222663 n=1 Tax=Uloborus diversus TaxID=327109 RepID=UPI00240971F3|nr:uncharacterized protein LOC129222663 [Uloborus diversus]
MEFFFSLLIVLGLLFLFSGYPASCLEECDVIKQRRCRQNLVEQLDKQSSAQSTRELEFQCRKLRQNMNCLVLQVTQCPTPNRSGDLIERAWKYMQDNCDTFGGWWNYECFNLEQMQKCEKIFALRDSAASQVSCREYDRFRHCISDVVKKQCNAEDVLSMGNYLLDSSGDMIWTCPHQSSLSKSPIVDAGFVGVDKHDTLSDQLFSDKHDKSPIALDQHLRPLVVSPLELSLTKKIGLGGKIGAEESHLSRVYSSAALVGDTPYATGCNARATEEMRGCLDRHQYERDQALGARDDEDRLRKECCATWNYRRCLQNAVRIHCYDTREVDIQAASDVIPHDRGFLCRNHWIYTCNSAHSTVHFSAVFVALTFFMTLYTNIILTTI